MELDKKIDQYTDELYDDLGGIDLPEEKKAEIYARLQDHLHAVILETLKKVLSPRRKRELETVLEQENYGELSRILKGYPRYGSELEEKVQNEFDKLKTALLKEQADAAKPE